MSDEKVVASGVVRDFEADRKAAIESIESSMQAFPNVSMLRNQQDRTEVFAGEKKTVERFDAQFREASWASRISDLQFDLRQRAKDIQDLNYSRNFWRAAFGVAIVFLLASLVWR